MLAGGTLIDAQVPKDLAHQAGTQLLAATVHRKLAFPIAPANDQVTRAPLCFKRASAPCEPSPELTRIQKSSLFLSVAFAETRPRRLPENGTLV